MAIIRAIPEEQNSVMMDYPDLNRAVVGVGPAGRIAAGEFMEADRAGANILKHTKEAFPRPIVAAFSVNAVS